MSNLLFANNASSTLAAPITSTATTISLAAGTGALFPAIGSGQYFAGTLRDAATRTVREIVRVTARSTDTLTVVRGQESTVPSAYAAGDLFDQFVTAGEASVFVQQDGSTLYAIDSSVTSGQITASLTPPPYALVAGMSVNILLAHSITGATNLNLNGFGNYPVVDSLGNSISGNPVGAASVATFVFTGSSWILAESIPLNAQLPGAPTTTTAAFGDATGKVATTSFVANAIAPKAPLASPIFTGTPTAPTAAVGTQDTQLATTGFANPWTLTGAPCGFESPGGVFTMAGVSGTTSGSVSVTFPRPFPTACVSFIPAVANYTPGSSTLWNLALGPLSASSAVVYSGNAGSTSPTGNVAFYWIAVGY